MDLSVFELATALCGLLGGGGGLIAILSVRSTLRKLSAEASKAESDARSVDLENMQKAVDAWKEIANERQEELAEKTTQNAELNTKIDSLYSVNASWRDKYNAKDEELTQLKVYKATNEVKLCLRRNCQDREPQTGY